MLTKNVYYAHKPDAIEIFPYRNGLCRVDFIVDLEETDEFEDPQYKADVYSLVTDYNDSLYDDIMDDFDTWIDKAKIADLSVEKAQKVKKVNNVRLMAASVDSIDPRTIHNALTYTTNLPQTVYGGSLDMATGELIVNKVMVTFNDVADKITIGINNYSYISPMPDKAAGVTNIICTCYETVDIAAADMVTGQIKGNAVNQNVFFRDGRYTDKTAFLAAMGNEKMVYELAEPKVYKLSAKDIETLEGTSYFFADTGELTIRYVESYRRGEVLDKMPLTIEMSGVGDSETVTVVIDRLEEYHVKRPNEKPFDGYEGETVVNKQRTGNGTIEVTTDDLIGAIDDTAKYRITAIVQDSLGQTAKPYKDFEVAWEHQAIVPNGAVTYDTENLIARITPIAPYGAIESDVCDVYRLSADRPELILRGVPFGIEYVDPFPTIGPFGGYRIVMKTANGDYITEDNTMAWVDLDETWLDTEYTILDFEAGRVQLRYNVDVSSQWEKDFQETKYMGGSVQGDWNAAVSRKATINAVAITLTEADEIETIRRLADTPGQCHIRTQDGSSFACDIQVSESNTHDKYGTMESLALTITRVDPEELDGMTAEEWDELQGE